MFKVSAPGKIILTGEHAVVYGCPALACSINKRLTITDSNTPIISGDKKIEKAIKLLGQKLPIGRKYNFRIKSHILIGSGMGSSAALAVALSTWFYSKHSPNRELNLEEVNKLSYEVEKIFHGNPSGLDNTLCAYGGLLWYRKETDDIRIFKKLLFKKKPGCLYFFNSGKPKESTKDMIQVVKENLGKMTDGGTRILKNFELVAKEMAEVITKGDFDKLFEIIKTNEKLLEKIGVVSESTKNIIKIIENNGGAAKICGAGGIAEGSGVVLVCLKDNSLVDFLNNKHALKLERLEIENEGVKIEKS